jgi:hypothetical protein
MGSELSLFGARLAKEAQELEGTSIGHFHRELLEALREGGYKSWLVEWEQLQL